MTTEQAVKLIKEMLFGKTEIKMAEANLMDGTIVTNNLEGAFEVGQTLYVVDADGNLVLAPANQEHQLEDGTIVLLDEASIILEIKAPGVSEMTEGEIVEQEYASATLTDGTKIEVEGDFEVGKKLYVIDADGNRVEAPSGEHTTDSGIVITVDAEGTITGVKRPDEAGEGSLEGFSSELTTLKLSVEKILDLIQNQSQAFEALKNDYQEFKASEDKKPINTKKETYSQSFSDYRLEMLKKLNK